MKKIYLYALILVLLSREAIGQTGDQAPKPDDRQWQWAGMEYYFFIHFGPNTFTDLEWGKGTEHEELFDPTALDCRQWCRIAKAAGAKGIIITAKHHDGFCLWPSQYSKHTVRESKWRDGKGDLLQELATACKEYGLKMGVYLSPWDRNHPLYGTAAYNQVFVNMMKEIVSRYGPLFEFWWDGANGEGPNGKKQVYDWRLFENTMREIAPQTVVFSDIGPDIRWVGNERGIAGDPNWNLLDTTGFMRGLGAPSTDTLNHGNVFGSHWIPAECDVSIRPGWFYHAQEDDKVKTPERLFQLWLKSVGRGSNLLLNVPPDRRGLINEHDSAALVGFRALRERNFGNNLAKTARPYFLSHQGNRETRVLTDGLETGSEKLQQPLRQSLALNFTKPTLMNCITIKENLRVGQQCRKFRILLMNDKEELLKTIEGTTIGKKRIISFPPIKASQLILSVVDQKGTTEISEIEVYDIDENLLEKPEQP